MSDKNKRNFDNGILTAATVAKLLHVTVATVYNWINYGGLKCYHATPRRGRRIKPQDLITFLNTNDMPVPVEVNVAHQNYLAHYTD